jgi:hypothetical protein
MKREGCTRSLDAGLVANLTLSEHEGNDALHALFIRPILLRELLAHELFFFAQLYPKAGERDHAGDKSAQVPEGNGGRERPATARCRYDFLR